MVPIPTTSALTEFKFNQTALPLGRTAGEANPFVLAGASAGGLFNREFMSVYPSEVAGMVFVDSDSPEQIKALPGREDSAEKTRRQASHSDVAMDSGNKWLGVFFR